MPISIQVRLQAAGAAQVLVSEALRIADRQIRWGKKSRRKCGLKAPSQQHKKN
jgi:hypothetical protein